MGIKIIRYFKLFLVYARFNWLRAMEYRADFVLSLVGVMIHSLGYIMFVGAIYHQVPSIQGWSFDQMLALFAVSQLMIFLSWAIFRFSLAGFPQMIKSGSFDALLKLPANARFVLSFEEQNSELPLPLIFAISMLVYSLRNVALGPAEIGLFILLFVCGLIIFYNLTFLLISLSFWVVEAQDLMATAEEMFSYSRYPINIFPTLAKAFFIFIVPTLLMVYVPTSVVLHIFDWKLGLASILMTIASSWLSEFVWKLGLKSYSSASS